MNIEQQHKTLCMNMQVKNVLIQSTLDLFGIDTCLVLSHRKFTVMNVFFLSFCVSLQFLFSVSLHSESLPVPECDISGGKKNIEEWYRMV